MATKILLADKLKDGAFTDMDGVEVISQPELTAASLVEAVPGARVLVVRSTKVTADAIAAADTLGLIVRAGSGYNNIDVEAASKKGIAVANCPGANAVAVAELAMGLMLSLDRRIPDNVADLRNGVWNKAGYAKAKGLKGRTLGLIGYGNIGANVAKRAQAFEMKVVVHDPVLDEARAASEGVGYAASAADVLKTADIVSLHVPAIPATKGMIGAEQLALLKDGAFLINTSRQEVVDNAAVTAEVESGRIFYGTDVFAGEPEGKKGDFADPIVKHANVYGTHHIGASTAQAQDAVAELAIHIVGTFLETGEVPHKVN